MRVRWRRLWILLLAGALAGLSTVAGLRPAAATTTGPGTFEGTMWMNDFPCAGCPGILSASAAMTLSGVPESGLVYSATWPDPNTLAGTIATNPTAPINLAGSFIHTDNCLISDSLPLGIGSGSGTFTLNGGLLVVNGVVWDNATLTGTMTILERVGGGEAITLFGLTISGGSGPSPVAISFNLNNTIVGEGVGTFIYTGTATCQNALTNQTADVSGTIEQPA